MLLLLCFNCSFNAKIYAHTVWRELAQGIDYLDLSPNTLIPWSHIHVFRINLNHYQLDIVTAKELSQDHASVEEMAHYAKAPIAINGGFFDIDFRPLGLRVGHHRQLSPPKPISWWKILYIIHNKPYLVGMNQYRAETRAIDFAIQSGPRLISHGKIPRLKAGIAERTAIGITDHAQIILLVTENNPMTTVALAALMQAAPLACQEALNLDGGSSTQIYTDIGDLRLNSRSPFGVSDAVIVKPAT